MELNSLLEILSDQRDELRRFRLEKFCERKEESLINLTSKKAQVVIGVRRSGKSTLCLNALIKAGVNFAYINFDDERFKGLQGDDLNEVLRALYQVYGDFTHLFMDEVQNVSEWFLFVNRLLRQGMHVLITGSNANLLSGELSTHLTGRHHCVELFPFSFAEYLEVKEVDRFTLSTKADAFRRAAFDRYLREGGFPEVVKEEENVDDYVDTLVNNILERDIVRRFKVRYVDAFKSLAHHLMNNAPCEIVYKTLQEQFHFKTDHTVENYVSYLHQAYMLMRVHKYSAKSYARVRNTKCYTVDVSLLNARKDAFSGENLGWRLETMVYIELKRRYGTGYDVYYYADRSFETDFVVCHRNTAVLAVQVSYDITNPRTRNREINGLVRGAKAVGCTELLLLTTYQEEMVQVDGYTVQVVPCYKWMNR